MLPPTFSPLKPAHTLSQQRSSPFSNSPEQHDSSPYFSKLLQMKPSASNFQTSMFSNDSSQLSQLNPPLIITQDKSLQKKQPNNPCLNRLDSQKSLYNSKKNFNQTVSLENPQCFKNPDQRPSLKKNLIIARPSKLQQKSIEKRGNSKTQKSINRNSKPEVHKYQTHSFAQTSRASCFSQKESVSEKDFQQTVKIQNYITESNMKKLEKFKSLFSSVKATNMSNQKQSQKSQTRKLEQTPEKYTTIQTQREGREKSFERLQNNKKLFDKHKRMLDQYNTRNNNNNKGQVTSLRRQGLDDIGMFSPDQFKTIDTFTIENSKQEKFEVTINKPKDFLLSNRKSLCCLSGEQSLTNHFRKSKLNQSKPPKPLGDKENLHKRDQTQLSNMETQSVLFSDMQSQMSSSKIFSQTITKPFNLSRSNSRRTKDVLVKEKDEIEKKMEEERMKTLQEQIQKSKEIPKNHYIPDMVVFKSTKTLTNFREFKFNSTSRKSSTSTNVPNYDENKSQSVIQKPYSVLFKKSMPEQVQELQKEDDSQDLLHQLLSHYGEDKENSSALTNVEQTHSLNQKVSKVSLESVLSRFLQPSQRIL